MYKIRPLTALLLGLAAVGGCGGGSGVAHPAAQRPHVVSTEATTSVTRAIPVRAGATHQASASAQYAAFARAVNLRAGDAPDFTSRPHGREQSLGEGLIARRCRTTDPTLRNLAKFSSSSFEAGPTRYREHTSSVVEIGPSPRAARAEVTAVERLFSNTGTRECLAAQYRSQFARSETPTQTHRGIRMRVTGTEVQIKPFVPQTLERAEVSGGIALGVRSLLQVSAHGRRAVVPFSVVAAIRYFTRGRAIVTLITSATDTQFPLELESRLISLLASRASAAGRKYPAVGS